MSLLNGFQKGAPSAWSIYTKFTFLQPEAIPTLCSTTWKLPPTYFPFALIAEMGLHAPRSVSSGHQFRHLELVPLLWGGLIFHIAELQLALEPDEQVPQWTFNTSKALQILNHSQLTREAPQGIKVQQSASSCPDPQKSYPLFIPWAQARICILREGFGR